MLRMTALARFAYDKSGSVIACVDQAELLAYSGSDEHPMWRHTCEAPLAGVGTTPGEVVSVDVEGRLSRWEALSGSRLHQVELGSTARALSVARDGTCAVLLDQMVAVVSGGRVTRKVPLPGATAIALSDDGARLAIGSEQGRVHIHDVRAGIESATSEVGDSVRGICWNVQGFWLATAGERICRVNPNGGEASSIIKASGRKPEHLASSADGVLIACQMERGEVNLVMLPSKEMVGTLSYQRSVEGLAFGPDVWLGVGLDRGDGNKINLVTGACHRTDTHPGRAHNSWELLVNVDKEKIRMGRSTANPSAEAVRAKLAAKAANTPASKSGGVLYVVGLVLFVIVCLIGAGWLASRCD
jgi:hypothetical protein